MDGFTKRELQILRRLDQPVKIQAYLDKLAYSTDPIYRSPRSIMRDRKAHCFDGMLFACAALRQHGYPPLALQMNAHNDDCHLLALFKRGKRWGAIGKSNYVGMHMREPIYRSLRELIMTYFDLYFNTLRQKTLRSFTRPLDLATLDHLNWMTSDANLQIVSDRFDQLPITEVLEPGDAELLTLTDMRTFKACIMGADPKGLFKPKRNL